MDWKFRAKCPICKNWHYGAIAFYGNLLISEDDFSFKKVDASTVCVFIGKKDRNGADIYTGDVLRWKIDGKDVLRYVFFSEKSNAFMCLDLSNGSQGFMEDVNFDDCEVVGNIFDDKDLAGGVFKTI